MSNDKIGLGIFKKMWGYIRLARPRQWIKNLFVFSALIFAKLIFEPVYLKTVFLATISFCLISSCVYILNDIFDADKDRVHPQKRTRPVAAGIVSKTEAWVLLIILLPVALIFGFYLNRGFGLILLLYFTNNVLYSTIVKHMVILDVMSIALGFLLRVIGGGVVIDVYISQWILLCTFLLSLFLGFSKRRNELVILEEGADSHRKILKEYSLEFIDNMLSIVTASTVMAYSLYTFSSKNSYYMILTIPFVLYGVFRYQYIVYQKKEGGSPEDAVLSDIPLMLCILLWVVVSIAILYLG